MHLKIHSNNHSNTTIWYSFSNNNNFHNNKGETWITLNLRIRVTCYRINRGRRSQGVVLLDKEVSQHKIIKIIKIIKIKGMFQIVKTFHREWWHQLWTAIIKLQVQMSQELNLDNRAGQTINPKVETHLKKTKLVNY